LRRSASVRRNAWRAICWFIKSSLSLMPTHVATLRRLSQKLAFDRALWRNCSVYAAEPASADSPPSLVRHHRKGFPAGGACFHSVSWQMPFWRGREQTHSRSHSTGVRQGPTTPLLRREFLQLLALH
jgi:hypothetical protein